MTEDSKDPDIQDVMREEKSLGKRRVDTGALQLARKRMESLREALKSKTEREFVDAMRELGLADDPGNCARL